MDEPWRQARENEATRPCNYEHCDMSSRLLPNFQHFNISIFLVESGWYRFVEPAGTSLPLAKHFVNGEHCNVCQTTLSAWVYEGRNPDPGEGAMNITLCFRESCSENITASAIACQENGSEAEIFYLYKLHPVKICNTAYCAV